MSLRIARWHMLWFTGLCLLVGVSVSQAAIKYVAKNGSDTNDGSQSTPWGTIQFGVTNIGPGDSLYIGEGTYAESVTNPASFGSPAQTNHSITIKGGWNTNGWTWDPKNHPSIINPGNTGKDVLTIKPTSNTVVGLTLTGGKIGLYFADPVYVKMDGYSIANCIISNNAGDGVYITGKIGLLAKNCLIVRNNGNGIEALVDNGGAYYLANCTIAYNGINGLCGPHLYAPTFQITNCILAFNSGAGITRDFNASPAYANEASSSCIFSNAAGNLTADFVADSGVIQVNPKFVNAATGDFHLQDGSPCVGYGKDLTVGVPIDLENTARSAPFDMGCYQSAYTPLTHYAATYADASVGSDSNLGNAPGAGVAKRTISGALAVTAPMGTCNVAAGTYPETAIVPYYGITLQGAGQESTTITNPGNWTAVYMYESNIVLRGFTVVGNNAGRGVMIGGPDPALGDSAAGPSPCADLIEQCTIKNAMYGVRTVYPLRLTAQGRQQHQLSRCTISNNLHTGIFFTQGVRATNCLVANNGSNGLYVASDGHPRSYFYYCTIANNGSNGYWSAASGAQERPAYFTNCIVTGNGSAGIRKDGNTYALGIGYSIVSGQPSNIWGGSSIVTNAVITNQVPTFQLNGFRLAEGSVGINIATNIGVTNDLIGGLRPFGLGYDMGAYELIPPPKGTIVLIQ